MNVGWKREWVWGEDGRREMGWVENACVGGGERKFAKEVANCLASSIRWSLYESGVQKFC